jgi:hypothetical protein
MSIPLRYGALLGLAQCIATLVVFTLGLHGAVERLERAQLIESLVGFILLMAVIALAHRALKADTEARQLAPGFGRSARFSALTALIAGLVTALGQYAYLAWINPGLRDLQRIQILERVKDQLAAYSPEQIAQSTQQIDYATSAAARGLVYGLNTFFFASLLGLAFALIFRAAVRRDTAAKT